MGSVFFEKSSRHSSFILHDDVESTSEALAPPLSLLRLEMERVHPGMSDFIVRVSTPKYAGTKSGTVLSIRGNSKYTKYDTALKVAEDVRDEMAKRGDKTHAWSDADLERLADLVYNPLKYFASQISVTLMRFTTGAL